MGYKKKWGKDVVTVFSRQAVRPAVDETGRDQSLSAPEAIEFILPDEQSIKQYTNQDIIIGRASKKGDPEIAVDLETHRGRALGVSRRHAMLKVMNDSLMLVDLHSVNGTFINDERALPTKRYVLMDGDKIRCGKLEMTLRFLEK